ncbi:hypothetical protein SGM_4244 [Streptomyces griseoaurantiacus M045]|uniref:Uncharacterized protein n=1 Tax=Streptomyces griseoaurantiacus M045 TaxID=996637 RepID=F3NLY9_9ACTN|nr:hypothetical protein SGM_4244 [Streptomyces griseoaurantiacus M045]
MNGALPEVAVTSDTSPSIPHRTSRAPCARATRPAVSQAGPPPSVQRSAAANAARSAAAAAL